MFRVLGNEMRILHKINQYNYIAPVSKISRNFSTSSRLSFLGGFWNRSINTKDIVTSNNFEDKSTNTNLELGKNADSQTTNTILKNQIDTKSALTSDKPIAITHDTENAISSQLDNSAIAEFPTKTIQELLAEQSNTLSDGIMSHPLSFAFFVVPVSVLLNLYFNYLDKKSNKDYHRILMDLKYYYEMIEIITNAKLPSRRFQIFIDEKRNFIVNFLSTFRVRHLRRYILSPLLTLCIYYFPLRSPPSSLSSIDPELFKNNTQILWFFDVTSFDPLFIVPIIHSLLLYFLYKTSVFSPLMEKKYNQIAFYSLPLAAILLSFLPVDLSITYIFSIILNKSIGYLYSKFYNNPLLNVKKEKNVNIEILADIFSKLNMENTEVGNKYKEEMTKPIFYKGYSPKKANSYFEEHKRFQDW